VSAVKKGGRIQLLQNGDPPTFDQHGSSTTYTNYVTSLAYNQLVKNDPAVGEENPEAILPDLATEWEVSPDGQQYTFHLVQNAKYHDGTPFVAADAKASLERQKDPPETLVNPPRGAQIQWIGSIDTPDDYTLVINANRPVSTLSVLPIMAQGWMANYSKKDIDAGFDFRTQVNGTGPYRFVSYQNGAKVVYDKNPDYFVADRPHLDGVDIFIVPDAASRDANFQGGKIDVYAPGFESLNTIQQALGDKVETMPTNGYGFSVLNYGAREPWTDLRVRQAVAMAHNRQAAIDTVVFGDGRLGGYMSGGAYWSLSDAELQELPGYEPFTDSLIGEARKLLDAAGVPAQLEGTILTRLGSENLSLFTQDQLKKLGINVALDVQETATAYDNLTKRNFDLAPWGHAYAVDDPDAVFSEFYITGAPRNYSEVDAPEVDDLFLKQSMEQDPETRRELVKDLQRLAVPLHGKTMMYWSNGRETKWKRVQDYVAHTSTYNNRRWQDTWLDV